MTEEAAKSKSRPRRWLRFSVGKLLGLTGVIALLLYCCRPLKTENFYAIENGMTRREVERLLGGRPGNYGWKPAFLFIGMMTMEGWTPMPPGLTPEERFAVFQNGGVDCEIFCWTSDDACLEVAFDDGKVIGKHRRSHYERVLLWP
ncbi:MAG: hypothetical protein AAGG44_21180 [Planctomycetota bacterium]